MKRSLLITQIILIFAAFLYSASVFDFKVIHRNTSMFKEQPAQEDCELNFSVMSPEIEKYELSSDINELAIKHDILVTKLWINYNGLEDQPYSIVFYSSNSTYLKDNVFVQDGIFEVGESYSSHPTKESKKISWLLGIPYHKFIPLTEDTDPGGVYLLQNGSGDFEKNRELFIDEIAAGYKDLYIAPLSCGAGNTDFDDTELIFTAKREKVGISLILILLLSSIVFTLRKKIALKKIEGATTLKIYRDLFLKDFLILSVIACISIFLLVFLIMGKSTLGAPYLLKVWLIEYATLVGLTLMFSSLLLIIIDGIPIVESIKGKTNLKEVEWIGFFVKLIIAILIIPMLTTGIVAVSEIVKLSLRRDEILERSTNLYTFGVERVSNYRADYGKENAINHYNALSEEFDMFEMNDSFILVNDELNNVLEIISIDELYIKRMQFKGEFTLERPIIFLSEKNNFKKIDILVEEVAKTQEIDKEDVQVVYYDDDLPVYGIHSLRYGNYVGSKPLVYVPTEEIYQGQVGNKLIIYEGTKKELQEIIDQRFIDFGYAPAFDIFSKEISHAKTIDSLIQYNINISKEFIILLVMLIISNLFMLQVHYVGNKSLYFATRCEGLSWLYVKNYLIFNVLPIGLALFASLINKNLTITTVVFFIIIELIMLVTMKLIMNRRFRRK